MMSPKVGADELVALKRTCDAITAEEGVQLALLLHRDGQVMVASGARQDIDIAGMAALSAGILAGAKGMAMLVNEREFVSVFHEGLSQKLLITPIESSAILTIHFDQRKTLGWVRFQARKHLHDLATHTKKLMHKFENAEPALSALSEDDFEALHFGFGSFISKEGGPY
jgi:predicted regulator of Ras-like GTPase activity (Roadblock/LC7/MglB family)